MAVVTVDSISGATASGWNVTARVANNWTAEKPVQQGGRWQAVGSTSDGLVIAMQNIEYNGEGQGTHGPKHSGYPGHI
jgi:hypothetical protein